MKNELLEQLNSISESDTASLLEYVTTLTQNITSYFFLGIDNTYYKELSEFILRSKALLDAYNTPDTHQADDTYWLLYWATCDDSLKATYNGYNYLYLLLSPSVQARLNQINLKEYIANIIKLIKPENLVKRPL